MSDKAIANSMLTTAACVTLGKALPEAAGGKGELPDIRVFIGIGFSFFVLTTIDDFAPQIAGPLAFAVAGTAFSVYGIPVIQKLVLDENPKKGK